MVFGTFLHFLDARVLLYEDFVHSFRFSSALTNSARVRFSLNLRGWPADARGRLNHPHAVGGHRMCFLFIDKILNSDEVCLLYLERCVQKSLFRVFMILT